MQQSQGLGRRKLFFNQAQMVDCFLKFRIRLLPQCLVLREQLSIQLGFFQQFKRFLTQSMRVLEQLTIAFECEVAASLWMHRGRKVLHNVHLILGKPRGLDKGVTADF